MFINTTAIRGTDAKRTPVRYLGKLPVYFLIYPDSAPDFPLTLHQEESGIIAIVARTLEAAAAADKMLDKALEAFQ